ncbi:MAG: GNAT family N-acetyltransferase [Clostridia bacterium]|nr:GNAT family N-acetyltransferase [Clostridia bacterium]
MENYTVNVITSFAACEAYVKDFCADNRFSAPMLSNDEQLKCNLIKAIETSDEYAVIGIYKSQRMVGLFSFLTLKDEKYLEMLVGLSRDAAAYCEMLDYLKAHFADYRADFIFNPNNDLLLSCLRQRGADFDAEQQKMIYRHSAPAVDTTGIELLAEPYIPAYLEMHNTDMYWTGDKVIEARDRFRTLVALERGCVVGYLDVTYTFEENEPFDLLVKQAYRRKGYGRRLLAKALEMNGSKGMMLLVDIDNIAAIRLYESLGFEKAENQNSLVAHLKI